MSDYRKPLPAIGVDNAPFWESIRRHAMALQRCGQCGQFRYPPRPLCPACHATDARWAQVSGKGRVYVSLVMYRAPGPAWEQDTPYNVAMIELDEGVRLWSNVVECDPESVRIGDDVAIDYDDVTDEVTLPRFRRVGHAVAGAGGVADAG
jgi:uncharacterized OB-fold protein